MKLLVLKNISLTLFRDPTAAILTLRMHSEAWVSVAEFSRLRSYRSGFLLYFSANDPFPPVYDIQITGGFLKPEFQSLNLAG
jgi:hypothetical protein